LSKDHVFYKKTKHIGVRYHFLRIEMRINVKKIGSADNLADMLTKSVPACKFMYCLNLLGIDRRR